MLDIKSKNGPERQKRRGRLVITAIVLLAAVSLVFSFALIGSRVAKNYQEVPAISESFLRDICQGSYFLYYELASRSNQEGALTPADVFLKSAAEVEGETYTDERYFGALNRAFWERQNLFDNTRIYTNYYAVTHDSVASVTNTLDDLPGFLTGTVVNGYAFYLVLDYDEMGNVSVKDIRGAPERDDVLKTVQRLNRSNWLVEAVPSYMEDGLNEFPGFYEAWDERAVSKPRGMTVIYAVPDENAAMGLYENVSPGWDWETYEAYRRSGLDMVYALLLLAVGLAAFLLANKEGLQIGKARIFQLPLEVSLVGVFVVLTLFADVGHMAIDYNNNSGEVLGEALVFLKHGLFCSVIFAAWYWVITALQPVVLQGLTGYIKERSLIYRFFPFMKSQGQRFYRYLTDVNLTDKTNRTIWKLVIFHFIVLSLMCCLWFFGILPLIIYSLVIFTILRKHLSDVQDKYQILLRATNRIAAGDLDVEVQEDLGVFEPLKEELQKIQTGMKKAVAEEVRSQRMKTELVTNVSHDLKTPLTAIITYVDLLKNKAVTEGERLAYIDTLERKSLRLKTLIEDLFEISKATSKDITLEVAEVDIVHLLKQARLELNDKIAGSDVDFRWNLPDEKIILFLDGQKTYRIFENLLLNMVKYAMPRSRAYIDVVREDGGIKVILRNISANELDVKPDELLERFVRGDRSRNMEGSGLGLAIAKSFVELQKGRLELEIDGDLFKVTVFFAVDQKQRF